MNIRHLCLLACLCLLLPAGAFAEPLLANIYPIDNVRELSVGGGASVEIRQGTSESLRAQGTKEALEHVSVDLRGGRLSLTVKDMRSGFFNFFGKSSAPITFIVEVKDLTKVELAGAAKGKIDALQGERLTIHLSGASNADIGQLQVSNLELDLSGAGRVTVGEVTGQRLNVKGSGASRIDITQGTVTDVRVDVSGASKYFAPSLSSNTAWANASGASHIELRTSDSLEAHASGASHITYIGNPRTQHHASGASRISSRND